MGSELALDSIPDSTTRLMHDFAIAYPGNSKSEKYFYMATLITEARGNFFETAKWCEEYVKLFPNGKNILKAIMATASNYEKSGTVQKAIEYYELAGKRFPNESIAKDGMKNAEMLKMGLITPEQQFDYIMHKKDSLDKLP